MRDLAECCVSCGLMVQLCGQLNKNSECETCRESEWLPDNQDSIRLVGIEEIIIDETTRSNFQSIDH